jgi:hypothetical protein
MVSSPPGRLLQQLHSNLALTGRVLLSVQAERAEPTGPRQSSRYPDPLDQGVDDEVGGLGCFDAGEVVGRAVDQAVEH